MMARIMMGLFHWDESLQVSTAHRLVTSLEQFRAIVQIIEENADLANQVKRIRWQHGAEEIQTMKGNRFIIKAGGSAARGLSKPETIHMDEIRELHDMETFAAMRYTLMAAKNPQVNCFSSAGDSHSMVLNQLRDRGLAAASGAADDVGYFEWSAPTDEISLENAAFANPGLNITIHPDNIRAVFNDPPDVVMTEVLNRWVQTISSVVGAKEWQECGDESIDLEDDKLTWMAIDISPDRKHAALCAAQKLGSEHLS
jgi:phage terminase large subunit-like protein